MLKPGPFNPDEWEIKKTHARLGVEAIEEALQGEENHVPLSFLHIAMDIAHSHHEKWDGSGYLDGIGGEVIPLPARLMAVADVFDALISKHVYKPAMLIDEAAKIIMSGQGSHFDPEIVAAFQTHLDGFWQIAARYGDD